MSVNALGVATATSLQQVSSDSVKTFSGSRSVASRQQPAAVDTTSFTSDKQTVQSLGQAALQTFPTRQQKVEALREAVNGAQYQLDSAKIAEALVSSEI